MKDEALKKEDEALKTEQEAGTEQTSEAGTGRQRRQRLPLGPRDGRRCAGRRRGRYRRPLKRKKKGFFKKKKDPRDAIKTPTVNDGGI